MSADTTVRPVAGRGRRRVVALLVVLGVLLPFVLTLTRLLAATGADVAFTERERDGVAYLRPLAVLVAATADAQTAAVAGGTVDAARLGDAVAAVDAVDARLGTTLGTTSRWRDLSADLDAVVADAPTGAEAYGRWTQVTDLQLALVAAVGDSSNLILDPDLDAYYVMDTTLLRLPRVLVDAGRLADLTQLVATVDDDAQEVFVEEAELVRGALTDQAEGIDAGLRKGFAATRSRTLGPALVTRLDGLDDALAVAVPPTAAVGAEAVEVPPAEVQQARVQVRDAALTLEAAALDELDALLAARLDGITADRDLVVRSTVAGAAALALAGWLALPRRRTGPEEDDEDDDAPVEPADDVVTDDTDLLEARDLLESRQLVRSGRAIASTREQR